MSRITSLIVLIYMGLFLDCFSQDTVSLEYCLGKVISNAPLAGNYDFLSNISAQKNKNIRSGNLPQAELNGKASYQSDVISLDIPIPGIDFPSSPRDQYKISLDISQSLYDGGLSKNRLKLESLSEQIEKAQLDLDIRNIKMQVKDLYYNLLLIQKNLEIVEVTTSTLLQNRKVVETGIKNGILLKTDMDLVDVEIAKIQQSKNELQNSRLYGIQVLSGKMGEDLSPSVVLQPTSYSTPAGDSIQRLEQAIFDLKSSQIINNEKILKSKMLPKVFAFGQFGYGNPALNMLKDKFETYYVVGAGLKWTLWDWNNTKRETEILDLQNKIVNNRKSQFESDIYAALLLQKSEIESRQANLEAYSNILTLRKRITANAEMQLQNGVIKTIDYISLLSQETIARMQYETEKILLQQAIAKNLELLGEL